MPHATKHLVRDCNHTWTGANVIHLNTPCQHCGLPFWRYRERMRDTPKDDRA